MNINFPFYCYIDGYHNDPSLYQFKSGVYTYDNINMGNFPRICFAYLEIFDFKNYHFPPLLTTGNSSIEASDCIIDENCETFVDIGANCGLSSYFAYLRGAKKIIAFEPSPKEAKAYLMNNIPNSILYQFGISNKTGFSKLPTVWSKLSNKQDDKFSYSDESPTYTVTLDYLFEEGLFNKIDFLKIDVEGHEYEVFDGLCDNNLMKIKNISVEIHGQKKENDPKLGLLFQQSLKNRLQNVPYISDTGEYKQRIISELYHHEQGFLYSYI